MKKIIIAISLLLISILIISCGGETGKNLTRVVNKFLNTDSYDLTIQKESGKNTYDLFRVKTEKNLLCINPIEASNLKFMVLKNKDFFINTNGQMIYTNLNSDSLENFEINIKDNIDEIIQQDDKVTFKLNLKRALKNFWFDFSKVISVYSEVKVTCFIEDNKVTRLEYGSSYNKTIIIVNSYNKNIDVNIPSRKDCVYYSEEEMLEYLNSGASGEIDKYTLILNNNSINLNLNEEFKGSFKGVIYDTVNKCVVKKVNNEELEYEKIKSDEVGKYSFKVSTKYLEKDISADVYVDVIGKLNIDSSSEIIDISKIVYGFNVGNYVYLCDKQYIYKYDYQCSKLYGKIDLHCAAKSHYVKGEYLYVAAYYPYDSTYLEEDAYDGSVTKIKLSDFTIDRQVAVSCLPHCIIVDNRDNVILTKGANQHIDYAEVNMRDGSLTPVIDGYERDIMVYDANRDILTSIPVGITTDSGDYEYKNNNWIEKSPSKLDFSKIYLQEYGLLVTNAGIYKYDYFVDDYVLLKVKHDPISIYNDGFKYITTDGENAYVIGKDDYKKAISLTIYNLEKEEYETIINPFEIKANGIICSYVYSNYLFIITNQNEIIKYNLTR